MGRTFEPWSVDSHINPRGMSVLTCALFIIGEMAGGGIVAMPSAVMGSSWGGAVLLLLGAVGSWYTGVQLGQSWTILQNLWPDEYREKTRKPYPAIGQRAFEPVGPFASKLVKFLISLCINLTLFGASCVYVLLASENIESLIKTYDSGYDISFCFLLLIIAACLLPFTFLATPVEFWPVSVGAMGTSTVAVIMIVIASAITRQVAPTQPVYEAPSFLSFVGAYATITFAYGGHSAFPTLQHDMRKPSDFAKAVALAYTVICLLYFPDALSGFIAYGKETQPNIIQNIGKGLTKDSDGNLVDLGHASLTALNTGVAICITAHVLFAILILLNVFNQEMEELFHVKHKFGPGRIVVRTLVLCSVVFIAETIPHFDILLSLIGGTGITCLTFIFPGLCHIMLKRQLHKKSFVPSHVEPFYRTESADAVYAVHKGQNGAGSTNGAIVSFETKEPIYGPPVQTWEYFINGIIITVGILAGIASTFGTIYDLASGKSGFTVPCYINLTAAAA